MTAVSLRAPLRQCLDGIPVTGVQRLGALLLPQKYSRNSAVYGKRRLPQRMLPFNRPGTRSKESLFPDPVEQKLSRTRSA